MLKFMFLLTCITIVTAKQASKVIPYHVSIRRGSSHLCSGTLIGDKWILTVADCVYSVKAFPSLTVAVGTLDITKPGETYAVSAIKIHEEYRPNRFKYNFALLKIDGTIQFNDNVTAIPLPDNPTQEGASVEASGWKLSRDKDRTDFLQVIKENTISNYDCIMRHKFYIDEDSILCTDYENGMTESDFFRDHGGPVVESNKVVGLVISYVDPYYKLPGFNSKVEAVKDWIQSNMQ
ncbi:trypsin-2-like isoform X2 [Pieris napi]|uniref:trypsin-2-like isoform X2 n=1 Tax=Pieris napi TaxID=78633 RepID=UPI001FBBA83C|nr:trypsin-2-like isoform X2 [Pieris napi]